MNTKTLSIRSLISTSPFRRSLLLITAMLGCFGLAPAGRAVTPAPDGGYANGNTAEGTGALQSLTTGAYNTALGFDTLFHNTTGDYNTATGVDALFHNTTINGVSGSANTANGFFALFSNTTGYDNTANGVNALYSNTTGHDNTANGVGALYYNNGTYKTATGFSALSSNTTGHDNTANGSYALYRNNTASYNTANGVSALQNNTSGDDNTAEGFQALLNNMGSNNIGLGSDAGSSLTTGSNNIDIGNVGVAAEASTIRIGTAGTHTKAFMAGLVGAGTSTVTGTAVVVNSNGRLGVSSSSARFKDQIKPMDNTSEAILALKPVTFRYKHELDPEGIPQFGLVAEEVDKVNPDLVARDLEGKVFTVRYEAVNAMLLNEFIKEHRKVEEQDHKIQKQEATIAEQQKQIEALIAGLQRVSDQLELSKLAPQVVLDNR